jgi:hypothetical protein
MKVSTDSVEDVGDNTAPSCTPGSAMLTAEESTQEKFVGQILGLET